MSTNQLTPTWIIQAGDMSGNLASGTVKLAFEDNVGIQCSWTGTPTGTLAVQVSLDPDVLGWETLVFSPAPTQPAGSASRNYFQVNQSAAAFVRLIYTAGSSTGTLNAKIAAKSV